MNKSKYYNNYNKSKISSTFKFELILGILLSLVLSTGLSFAISGGGSNGGGGGTTITSGAGDFGSGTAQSGAVLTGVVTGLNSTPLATYFASPPTIGGTTPAAGTFTNINQANSQGAIGSGGTLNCNMSLGAICFGTAGAGAFTIAKPTNGVVNQQYYLAITSTSAAVVGTYASGWLEYLNNNTLALPDTFTTGVSGTLSIVPFQFDGTNYQIASYADLSIGQIQTRTIKVGNQASLPATTASSMSVGGSVTATGGGAIQSTGGTAPTCSAATGTCVTVANANCTGSTTPWACCTGSTTGTCSGSTNNRGQIHLTGGSSVTAVTLTFSAAGTFGQAPYCEFSSSSTINPISPLGPCGATSSCIAAITSATAADINYQCE